MPRYLCVPCWLTLSVILAGCGIFSSSTPPPTKPSATGTAIDFREDPLRIGDRVTVELSGIADPVPPKEQDIKEDGTINLPYIHSVVAAGKSPSKLEKEIETMYVPKWYPRITVTVTPVARYFFVMGQVTTPGRILYTGPIKLLGAIGAAGDFTPFAKKGAVQVIHADGAIETINCRKAIRDPKLNISIHPGDQIQVGRRF